MKTEENFTNLESQAVRARKIVAVPDEKSARLLVLEQTDGLVARDLRLVPEVLCALDRLGVAANDVAAAVVDAGARARAPRRVRLLLDDLLRRGQLPVEVADRLADGDVGGRGCVAEAAGRVTYTVGGRCPLLLMLLRHDH